MGIANRREEAINRGMICVKDVSVARFNSEVVRIRVKNDPIPFASVGCPTLEPQDNEETVVGRYYRVRQDREVCIGMTQQVQEILGIPLGAMDEAFNALDEAVQTESKLREGLRKMAVLMSRKDEEAQKIQKRMKSLTMWQRIKILLGVNPLNVK